jgi:hypothetical protein
LTIDTHLSDETIRGEIWLRVSLSVLRAIFNPQLRHQLEPLVKLVFQLRNQQTGLEYIRTIMYCLSDATDRGQREDLVKVLRQQGSEGERVMATIAQEYIQEGIQLGIKQGLEQGLEQGRIQNLQDNILDLLDIRFGEVSEEVEEVVTAVTNPNILRQLLREAVTAVSLTAFTDKLTALTGQGSAGHFEK